MNRRRLVPSLSLLSVVLVLAALTLRRPGAGALVISADGSLRVLAGGVAFAPRWRDRLEPVPLVDGALDVSRELGWQTPEGASYRGRLRLRGVPPTLVPSWYDAGLGFLASLDRHAAEVVRRAGSAAGGERALRDELEAGGWRLSELAAELDLGGLAPPEPLPALAAHPRRPPVLVLGLDGLDRALIDPMMARGELPTLARLADPPRGAIGQLDPFEPLLSPLLWTTMATGVGPEEHGILDFLQSAGEAKSGKAALTPVMSTSRRVPALWNLTTAASRRAGVLGWWATFPAEAIRGVMVSDRASAQLFIRGRENLRGEGVIYPPGRAAELERFLLKDEAVSDQDVARYVHLAPADIRARRAKGDNLDPVVQLVRLLASTRSYIGMAEHLWQVDRPDLMLLYVEGTDTVGHLFAPYHPPRLPWIDATEQAIYGDAVREVYRAIDGWLAPLVDAALAGGATVVVVSDHGFAWGSDRPRAASGTRTATAALWHRDRAVFWVRGAGARAGGTGTGTLFDVAPTLLAMLGLPAGSAMRGQALDWALADAAAPVAARFAYAEQLPPVGPTPTAAAADTTGSAELMAKLQALGYIGGGGPGEGEAAVPVSASGGGGLGTKSASLNLGTVLLEKGDAEGALAAYQQAVAADPDDAGARNKVGLALQTLGRYPEAITAYRAALERTKAAQQREAAWLGIGLAEKDAGRREAARDAFAAGARDVPESFPLLSNLARLEHQLGNEAGALAALEGAHRANPIDLETLNLTAALYAKRGRIAEARRMWEESLRISPEQPQIREFLRLLAAQG